jgi:hypothetical protein
MADTVNSPRPSRFILYWPTVEADDGTSRPGMGCTAANYAIFIVLRKSGFMFKTPLGQVSSLHMAANFFIYQTSLLGH